MKKRNYTKRQMAVIILLSIGMIALSVTLNRLHPPDKKQKQETVTPGAVTTAVVSEETATTKPTPTVDPTEKIATFLQGPKSWGERRVWSGEWGDSYYDGGSFGGFGCGLCCMANIYTSLTPYECSPLDMYRYAKNKSGYGGGGAIDWGYIKETLKSAGFTCDVGRKPSSYERFQKKVKSALAMLVVVSSQDSTCYWKDTPGHYVTLFLYDEKTDRIFLADSGDPDHNRQWVSLKKIYLSLKTANNWQYLEVTKYEKSADTWRHRGYGGTCILPD